MKKTLAILLSVVLILAMVPMAGLVSAEMSTEEIWNQFFITSDGATVTDCTAASGSITFKATLPSADSYVQLNQKLTDLFDGAKFTVATNSSAESCYLQLTDDATAETDIVPVAENSADPGTDGMTWLIYKSGNFVVFGRGANTAGFGSRLSTYGRFSGDGIADITFGKLDDGKVAVSAPEFTTSNIACGFTDYAPSTKTAEEVGLTDGGYFRLRNRDAAEHTYTVTVYSKDISAAYKDGDFILSDFDSKVNSSSVTYADGKATYTYNVTLATKDSYVQLDKKLSDLFTDAKFTVGTNSSAETCYLQLTADATAKTDIVPVNEYGGVNPGTVGMTWLIYKSGNFVVFGRGVNPNGLGSRLSTYGRFSGDGIADITFGKVDGDKVAVSAPEFTTSGYNCGFTDYAPSTKTAEEVGLTNGGYFRLRNRDNGTHTFTVSITTVDTEVRPITVTGGTASVETAAYGDSVTLTPDKAPDGYKFTGWNVVSGGVEIANNAFTMGSAPVEIEALYEELPTYTDGNYILSDRDSKIVDSSVTYADGKASYTATVELSTKDSYVQLNKKLTDLFNGANLTVATNSSAETCYLQLTDDATAETDIVPVAENSVDPGTDGMTWLIYKSGNFVVFGRGANTAGFGSRLSTYGRFSGDGIADITFGKLDDGKVAVSAPEFTTSNIACGFTDYAPSTKTAEEVGLTDGGYFRLRNRDDAEHTFTFTITTADTETRPITVTGGTASVETAGYGDSVTLTPGEAAVGYKFAGWNVVSGGVEIVDNTFTMGSEPVVIEAVYEETTYTDGNYILSDPNSKLVSSSVTRENGKVLYTATVELSGNGSYVQLNEKATNLIGGSDSVKVTIGENADINDYYNSNFYIQLTADATGNDIVPKDDSASAPNTDAISFRLFGYNNQYVMYTNKVASGAGAKYYSNRLNNSSYYTDVTNGMTVIFPENADDNKVQIRNSRNDLVNAGVAGIYTSNQTAADINGQDGVYVRLRNNKDEKVTYTFTVTTADAEAHSVTVTGGTASVETATSGATVTLTPDEAATGYEFTGWNVVSGGVEIADNSFVMGTEDVVVEAVFEKIDYTVTVDGEVFATVNYGDTVTLTVPEAATGYEFAGWNVVSGGVEIADNSFVMGTENVVIESTFEKIDYTVTVDDKLFATVNYGDTVTLEVPEVANGYTFTGWTVVSGGVEIADNAFVMGTENVVVTSNVEKIPYTVTVDGELQDGNVYIGDTVTLTPATPKDSYVEFDKWEIVSGDGASIEGNVLTIGSGNVEVKATFKAVKAFGDIRDLVRFDEVGADAPGVGGVFKAFYTALDNIFNFSTIRNFLFGK